MITYIYPIGKAGHLKLLTAFPPFFCEIKMNLKAIKEDTNIVFSELSKYIDNLHSILDKIKIVISNDLGHCKRDNCTVDRPCSVCKSLYKLNEDIDSLLE